MLNIPIDNPIKLMLKTILKFPLQNEYQTDSIECHERNDEKTNNKFYIN